MTVDAPQIGSAIASPTKSFFVSMLTRDIELQDALLDLLDNCVDGIVRSGSANYDSDHPYDGFEASITLAPDYFTIEDNCGGIPIEVAKKYAFAIGRPAGSEPDDHSATVGMYGIGMKRAIFKIGTEALVESQHDTGFIVEFSPSWMADDSWDELPMYELEEGKIKSGTRIEIYELNAEAAAAFSNKVWIDDFRKAISRHYALIIQKGFQVRVGAPDEVAAGLQPIPAEDFKLLRSTLNEKGVIAPYVYMANLNGVEVEIYAGLYRELLSDEEAEDEEQTRGSIDDAGWTIACNDRVVVWKDKSRLTGWGEADVPNYHGQFIAITGIVLLKANDPKKLPLTTTKRGVDGSSNLYSEVKDLMREATKSLTTFTNRWKKFPKQLDQIYRETEYVDLPALRAIAATLNMAVSRKNSSVSKYLPEYPAPPQEKTSARVVFTALKTDISLLSMHYFGEEKIKPGVVGEAAFNEKAAELAGGDE